MGLKPCSNCGRIISTEITNCPKCGEPTGYMDPKKQASEEEVESTRINVEETQPVYDSYSEPQIEQNQVYPDTNPSPSSKICQERGSVISNTIHNQEITTFSDTQDDSPRPKKFRIGLLIILLVILVIGIGVAIGIPVYKHQQAEQEAQERYERFRRDSIAELKSERLRIKKHRQDSIKAVEERIYQERIENATLHMNDFLKYDNEWGYQVRRNEIIKRILENKDFDQTEHHKEYITDTSWGDFWEETWTYSFFEDKDNKVIKLYDVVVYNMDGRVIITVYDSELYDLLKNELDSKDLTEVPGYGGMDPWKRVDYNENKIDICFWGD